MRPLNLDAMQAAAQNLVGQHDFAAFGSPPKGENIFGKSIRLNGLLKAIVYILIFPQMPSCTGWCGCQWELC
jgi:hypothetical protein